jgi:hypothetical protein
MFKWPSRRRTRIAVLAGVTFLLYLGSTRRNDGYKIGGGPSSAPGSSLYHRQLALVRQHELAGHSRTFDVIDRIYVVSGSRNTERRKVIDSLARALDFEFTYVNSTDFITPGEGKEVVENILGRIRWQRPRLDEREASQSEIPEPVDTPDSKFILTAFPFEWSKDAVDNADDPLAKSLGISGADYWSLQPLDQNWELRNPLPELTLDQRAAKIPSASRTNNLVKKSFIPTTAIATWHSHVTILREIVEKSECIISMLLTLVTPFS